MLLRVALVRTDISKGCITSIVLRLLVTAKVPSSQILLSLIIEAILSCEMSVLRRATQRIIQEDGILHSHRRDNRKLYMKNQISLHTPRPVNLFRVYF
jgi:hypothetical protein